MSVLHVSASSKAIQRVRVDLLAVGFYEDERPLRGRAGQVDWRLCGALSRLIRAGRTRGARGDAVLMPAGDGLFAARVLALGLGPVARCDQAARRDAIVDALVRATALRVRSLAVPFEFAGASPDDERGLDALLEAVDEGWQAGGRAAGDGKLVLLGRPGHGETLLAALRARARTAPPGLRILSSDGPGDGSPAGLRGLSAGA
jgi:hypothetical protein